MARTTIRDVRGFVPRLRNSAVEAGVPNGDLLDVEPGSSTNGVSWKLVYTHDRGARTNGLGWGSNFLGMTAGEALKALQDMAAAWDMASEGRKASCHTECECPTP